MRTDRVYEVIDLRPPRPDRQHLMPLAILGYVPGGIEVVLVNKQGFTVDLPDEDASERFEDDSGIERVTLHFEDGDVVFDQLTAERYDLLVRPFVGPGPAFAPSEEDAMHRYWRNFILDQER